MDLLKSSYFRGVMYVNIKLILNLKAMIHYI